MNIYADFSGITKDIGEDREYHQASIQLEDQETEIPVRLKTRGNFRRKRSVCNFPPLRLNFKKDSMAGTIFEGINKLKLVTHCQKKKLRYEQIVLQEHIIYQAYAALSPVHYKTRLVRITYHNTAKENDTTTRWGLFLEPTKHMAKRNSGKEIELEALRPESTDTWTSQLIYIFEYMIGNTDFSVPYQHNIKLISQAPNTPPIPVPYDFDWCGCVNAPYAQPNPTLDIASVQQRKYRGFCWPVGEQLKVIQSIVNKKEVLISIVNNEPGMDPKLRKKTLEYLESFFEITQNSKKLKREILDVCREL